MFDTTIYQSVMFLLVKNMNVCFCTLVVVLKVKHLPLLLLLLAVSSLRRAVEEREQKVAVLEECRSSVDQEASMLRSSRRELEKSRLQARRELQELRRQVKQNLLVQV